MADYVLGSWWVGVSVAGHWQKNLLWHPFGALTKKTLIKAYGKTGPWLLVWIFFVKDGCTHGIAGIVFMNQLPSWKKTTRAWNLVLWKMNFPSGKTPFFGSAYCCQGGIFFWTSVSREAISEVRFDVATWDAASIQLVACIPYGVLSRLWIKTNDTLNLSAHQTFFCNQCCPVVFDTILLIGYYKNPILMNHYFMECPPRVLFPLKKHQDSCPKSWFCGLRWSKIPVSRTSETWEFF